MYPLKHILKDIFLFPIDYYSNKKNIKSVRNVTVAVTHKCNIRCEMCYFKNELSNKKEMSLSLFKKVIDEIKRYKPCVILSGGEPFTHKNIIEMMEYAKKANLPVQIFTNGTLVDENNAKRLTSLNLDYINFTLLGNPNQHDIISNTRKTFEKFYANLKYFAENRKNTKVILNYTITPLNYKNLDYALELGNLLGLDGIRYQHYNFLLSNEIKKNNETMKEMFNQVSSTNEIENNFNNIAEMGEYLSSYIHKLKEKTNIPIQWAPTLTEMEIRNWYSTENFKTQRKCFFPWRGILIDANGKIYPCSKIYLELGSIEGLEILSVWNNTIMQSFRKKLKDKLYPACSRCCKL